jgi:hypothetical protein
MYVNEKGSTGSDYIIRGERHSTSEQNTLSNYTSGSSSNAETNLHPYIRVELHRIISRDECLYHGQILQHIKIIKKKLAKYQIINYLLLIRCRHNKQNANYR